MAFLLHGWCSTTYLPLLRARPDWFVRHAALELALPASPASLPGSFSARSRTPRTRLLALRLTCAAPVTPPQDQAVSFNLLYEGRVLPRPAGLLSAVPTGISSPPAAGARPRAGPTIRPRAGALCLQHSWLARSPTLRWVFRRLLPPHGLRRCAAAARTLGRSPSHCCASHTSPRLSLSDHIGSLACARAVTRSTSLAVGPASGRPRPLPRRQQRVRRRRGGSACSLSSRHPLPVWAAGAAPGPGVGRFRGW